METLPFLLILYAGLTHALEADHVLAVSNIVTQRHSITAAAKDGIYWGLGHTSTIMAIGVLMIVFKMEIPAQTFSYFEVVVGFMLMLIGAYRLAKFFKERQITAHRHNHIHPGANRHSHIHFPLDPIEKSLHKTSFGIGLVHGLAGSGVLVVFAMTQFDRPIQGIAYLLLYGIGAIVGMFLAAGIFSIPFAKRVIDIPTIRMLLTVISSLLCLTYGFYVIYHDLLSLI